MCRVVPREHSRTHSPRLLGTKLTMQTSAYESRALAAQGRLIGKKIALFCDHKFEDMEVMWPKMRLEEEGAEVVVIGCHPAGTTYNGKFGYPMRSAKSIDDDGVAIAEQWDALVLPGGFAPDYYRRSAKMLTLTTAMAAAAKPIAAICHGPWMLCSARRADGTPLCTGHQVTAFSAIKDDVINAGATWMDQPVVVSAAKIGGNTEIIVTSRTPNDLVPWVRAIIDLIATPLEIN